MSDEGPDIGAANDATSDGADTEERRESGGRTAVVTKAVARPQRPTGKRSRQRMSDAEEDVDAKESTEFSKKDSAKEAKSAEKSKKAKSAKKPKKTGPAKARAVNPIAFVYTYLKQVVAEMRKVIWPNRKQMITYTSVVLAFLAFMVALVGLADLGLTKLVMLVFG